MTIQNYYIIDLNDDLMPEEYWELKESAPIFGIINFTLEAFARVSINFKDNDERDIRDKLGTIAAWMGRIGADHSIITISQRTDYHTNYEFEDLNLLLTQDTRGSC